MKGVDMYWNFSRSIRVEDCGSPLPPSTCRYVRRRSAVVEQNMEYVIVGRLQIVALLDDR